MTLSWNNAPIVSPNGAALSHPFSATFEPGQLWAVIGANGSGKTCMLNALAGQSRDSTRAVRLGHDPIARWSATRRANTLMYLPQQLAFPPYDTVARVIMQVRRARQPWFSRPDAADQSVVESTLSALDLDACRHRAVHTLSGGEHQRLGIACALVHETPWLILDEPLNHLDIRHQVSMLRHLRRLSDAGHTALFSIHDITLASAFATHIIALKRGQPPMVGPASEVLSRSSLAWLFDTPFHQVHAPGPIFLPEFDYDPTLI